MKKHLSLICKVFLTIALISSIFLLVACQQEPEIQDKELGSILGHVFYSNGEDHSGIVLTLDKTDGLMAITQSDGSRAIVSMAVSNEDGSFAFYNLEPGTYTIYASSNDSVEKAVSTNVVVSGKDIVTAADLLLTATGSLSGNVILDESKTGNIGFLVFLAGTSYMAVTDDSGYYCISNVPAGENYQLIVSKGGYISSNVVSCSVTAHAKTSMSEIALLSDDILSGSRSLVWKGSLAEAPAAPKLFWAYFNTTDGCSYLYDGTQWSLLAAKGDKGEQGLQGETGANGTNGVSIIWRGSFADASEITDAVILNVYFNTTDGCSYIYDGTKWTYLAVKGATGETGAQGSQGEPGVQGPQGEAGADGANGVSIAWIGEYADASEIKNAAALNAYFNTTDGCSYIYDGSTWKPLALKGATGEQGPQGETGQTGAQGPQGETGATGAAGENGISIVWRGNFADASEIENVAILNVYFNTTDGCSYIYDGTKWTLLAAKGATGETGSQGPQGETGATGTSITWKGSFATAPSEPGLYWAYFNTDDGCSYIFDGTDWTLLAAKGATGETGSQGPQGETGATGASGANGVSIIWRGSFADASEIENAVALNAYFNTTDGCSYIYDGTKWTLLAAKGATGETGSQGPQGETGATGTSITWKGSFATAPSEPGLYWAYFNTDDGCSYIFDGTDWTLLAAKGATGETGSQGPQGETGATGASGANGVSIIWRGSFADASEIENAVALNAYFNTTDGCSYIYDGTNWTLLAAKGATGAQGENGHTLIKDEAVAPTCTQTGLTEGYHCALCGEVIIAQETVPVVAHTWGDGVVTTAVQETTDGVMTYTCTVCGATKEEAIHCTGGDWKFRQVNGNPEKYKTCADCGEEICEAATYDEMFYIQGTVLYPQYDSALDKTAIITGDWIIPSSIGESTINVVILYNQDELTGLTPPDTVTYIGIENCPNLRYLYIPASVSLDAYTLQMIMAGCASDVVIEISPDHENFKIVDGMLLSKDGKSFISPLGLSGSVTIPDGVTTIEENAFYYNQIVTEVILPESVTTIGDSAFSGPSIARVNIPDGVTTIGDEAFYGSSVTEITIPASVTMLGDYVFSSCENLRTVSLLLSLESIGSQMFYGCTSLESITIPSSVTSIGEYAFSQCTSLESITLPSSLERIEDYAFEYCSGLKSISIPASVTYIGDGAFSRCAGLYVEVDSANEYYLSDNGALYNKDRTELLLDQVTSGDVVISSSVTSIGYAAFAGNSGITSLSIPNTVTSIGYSAFADCENLTEVTIAINGNLIANGAFYGTSAHVTIETGSKGITYGLFNGCDATGITIPETVTYISGYAFANMTAAITITLPASLSSVETFAFIACGCDIVFASGTTNIPHNVLYRSDIRHITIPVSITSLYKSSFESCYLTDITYEGTQEQWAAVTKESGWEDCLSSSSVIHCTDGDVTN